MAEPWRARFDLFGRLIEVVQSGSGAWAAYLLGNEGKRRLADDIRIPAEVPAEGLAAWLDDTFHEWATPRRPAVRRVDEGGS
ncbi:MAG: hypothetical protein KDG55_18360 [Rhodocyclaceae bacterium]|nr:hypothetical protein [Rhodocyclaceae bacterium]